jgi:glycosyltransferase involved in cell wall biosynthesis
MRVVLVSSRYPWPRRRGNQARSLEWLRALAGHELRLLCPAPAGQRSPEEPAGVLCWRSGPPATVRGLLAAAASGRPLQEGLYDCAAARRLVAATLRDFAPDVLVVQMVRCAWATEHGLVPAPPPLFDAIDAMSLHFGRAAAGAPAVLAPLLRREAARCRRRERSLAAHAGITTAVAARDLEALGVPADRGRVVPVSARVWRGGGTQRGEPVVLLSGNLGYRPTVQGALWFAREVWPALRRAVPAARWVLAGARPVPAVRRLARLPGVEVHADVPDLEPFLAAARVAIAPMRSDSGVPMKVLEAMAAGVPAVVHPWAAAGLAPDAADAAAVARRPEEWTTALVRLLSDASGRSELAAKGRDAWRKHYHPEVVAERIRAVVTEAAGSRSRFER